MKKIIVLFFISLNSFAYEDIPIIPLDVSGAIQYSVNQEIEFKNIKHKDRIEKAQTKANEYQKQKIIIDAKQANYQRALDYVTRQNNFLLPKF